MPTRREFLAITAATAAASAVAPPASAQDRPRERAEGAALPKAAPAANAAVAPGAGGGGRFRPPGFGLGGVALGTGFAPLESEQADGVMRAAWDAGVRYFDTSPWYGLGVSERRMAHVLTDHPRDEYVLSTKVGRLLTPAEEAPPEVMWKAPSPFAFHFDYTADGARRSIEDSLHRMGLSYLDLVFIHDLSPDHFGEEWAEQFAIAEKGAMPALTKMREEGIIRAWGFGVNDVEPCLRALETGDPDVFLLATQYSIVKHNPMAIDDLFPRCEERGVSIVVGAPLNSGFLAGRERFNYKPQVPAEIREKASRIEAIAKEHGTDLRTAALQFCAAPRVVSAVIPGASTGEQVRQNAASMEAKIPAAFWETLKREKLIAENAATPG